MAQAVAEPGALEPEAQVGPVEAPEEDPVAVAVAVVVVAELGR